MTMEVTCPSCGQQVSAEAKFCRFCGASIQVAVQAAEPDPTTFADEAEAVAEEAFEAGAAPEPEASAAPEPEPAPEASAAPEPAVAPAPAPEPAATAQFGTCPTCGAPQTKPGQKFCASCGSTLGVAASGASAPQPGVAGAATAAASTAAAAASTFAGAAGTASERFSQASSSLDTFMGANVDLDSVGRGFDAAQVNLAGASDESLAAAFAFFDKVYRAGGEAVIDEGEAVQVREQLDFDEGDAAMMAEQDFYARSFDEDTHVSYEMFAAGMSDELVPTVAMLTEETKSAAAAQETKERLKNKVATGEMTQEAAVEKAEA